MITIPHPLKVHPGMTMSEPILKLPSTCVFSSQSVTCFSNDVPKSQTLQPRNGSLSPLFHETYGGLSMLECRFFFFFQYLPSAGYDLAQRNASLDIMAGISLSAGHFAWIATAQSKRITNFPSILLTGYEYLSGLRQLTRNRYL